MDRTNETASAANMREMQTSLEHLERREWWRWATALVIMLLLPFGVFSLSLPGVRKDTFTTIQLDLAVRGLFALVVVFDIFVIYQQIVISRLRRQLANQIGMMSVLEALKPASPLDQSGRKERRKHPRHPFDQRVKVKVTSRGKEGILFGRIIDISPYGLAAVLSGSLDRGDKVVLEFNAGAGTPALSLSAIIRYANGFRYGMEFLGVSALELEHLKRACRAVAATTTSQGRNALLQATLIND
jgi:PilZ domain